MTEENIERQKDAEEVCQQRKGFQKKELITEPWKSSQRDERKVEVH